MKKNRRIIMLLGIFMLVSALLAALAAFLLFRINVPNASIIGGADNPTAIFLMSEFKVPVIIIAGEILVGIICIIAAVSSKNKKGKGKKKPRK